MWVASGLDVSLGLCTRTVKSVSDVCDTGRVRTGGFLGVRGPLDHGTFFGTAWRTSFVDIGLRGKRQDSNGR
jgi:hypothetical protein